MTVSDAGCLGGESISQSKWSSMKMHFGVVAALSAIEKLKSVRRLDES
jgi:hypothetical protein